MLASDRTNWRVGAGDINILMLSIVYRGVGFPVVWLVLPWSGNSATPERRLLLEIFFDLFGAQNIAILGLFAITLVASFVPASKAIKIA